MSTDASAQDNDEFTKVKTDRSFKDILKLYEICLPVLSLYLSVSKIGLESNDIPEA